MERQSFKAWGLLASIRRNCGPTVSQALLDEKVSPSSSTCHILGLAIAQIMTVTLPSFRMLHLATTRKRDGFCIMVKNFNLDYWGRNMAGVSVYTIKG